MWDLRSITLLPRRSCFNCPDLVRLDVGNYYEYLLGLIFNLD